MSDILIKGMEMPKGNDYLHLIIQNGKVHKAISCGHLTTDELNVAEAVELPDSSWHTGTPTEIGWYLTVVKVRDCDKTIMLEYEAVIWDGDILGWGTRYHQQPIVAWQKIEPYNPEANYRQVTGKLQASEVQE